MKFMVHVAFDEVERRYCVVDSDIPGPHADTDTREDMIEVTMDFAPDLVGERAAGAKIEFER
jgi:hypothetical protein